MRTPFSDADTINPQFPQSSRSLRLSENDFSTLTGHTKTYPRAKRFAKHKTEDATDCQQHCYDARQEIKDVNQILNAQGGSSLPSIGETRLLYPFSTSNQAPRAENPSVLELTEKLVPIGFSSIAVSLCEVEA